MQSSIVNKKFDNNRTVSFDTENDRVKGFAILMRSNLQFNGIGKNKFIICEEQYKILKSKEINFKEI
jgi:hypothetical protein